MGKGKNEQDEKKMYVAVIMEKHFLQPYASILNPVDVAVGVIDEKTGVFKAENGAEYMAMNEHNFLFSHLPFSYFNVVELNEWKKKMNFEGSLEDAIREFKKYASLYFYYASIDENGEIGLIGWDHRDLRKSIADGKNTSASDKNDSKDSCTSVENDEKIECYDDISDAVNEIMLGIVNNKYSYVELLEIQDELQRYQEDCEAALMSVERKLEIMNSDQYDDVDSDKKERPTVEEKKETNSKQTEEKERMNLQTKTDDHIDIDDIYDKVRKTLIAQDEPALRMIVEIARMYADDENKDGILLTGSTGVGKTKLMSLIAKYLDKPFIAVDSTQLTIPGYVGKSIEQVLWDLYVSCGKDKKKAERAIVYFDEIDKKGSEKKSDIAGQGVLNVLLKFLDGTTYTACPSSQHQGDSDSVKIDTSNMIVVVGGAFADVYKNLSRNKSIGFGADLNVDKGKELEPTLKDFVETGMVPEEFMGRVPIVVHLNDLTQDSMRKILTDSDESPIKIEEKRFGKAGVKLKVTESYLDTIAQNAFDLKTGARGLKRDVADTTWKPFYEVSRNGGVYEEVVLDAVNSEGSEKKEPTYQLVKKRNTSCTSGNNINRK